MLLTWLIDKEWHHHHHYHQQHPHHHHHHNGWRTWMYKAIIGTVWYDEYELVLLSPGTFRILSVSVSVARWSMSLIVPTNTSSLMKGMHTTHSQLFFLPLASTWYINHHASSSSTSSYHHTHDSSSYSSSSYSCFFIIIIVSSYSMIILNDHHHHHHHHHCYHHTHHHTQWSSSYSINSQRSLSDSIPPADSVDHSSPFHRREAGTILHR